MCNLLLIHSRRAFPSFGLLVLALATVVQFGCPVNAFEWVPSDEEIRKYRRSWNPFSHGPILLSSPDVQPKGQQHVRPFIFTQIGTRSFGNQLRLFTDSNPGPVHLYSAQIPFIQTAYGITNNLEFGAATSFQWYSATENDRTRTDSGLGDTSLVLKYRAVVQDPGTWRPTFTWFNQLALPTSKWFGIASKPPGGFAPIGRFPSTRFGEVGITSGLSFRKNLKPFRISGGVFYTYSAPGTTVNQSNIEVSTYPGDVINTRFIFEHILSDKHGFGYNLEFVTLHELTFRADGHAINAGQRSGSTTIGLEPALQWRFGETNFVGAAGVLFTLAGQNAIDAIYPNFSIFYYFTHKKGQPVLMR